MLSTLFVDMDAYFASAEQLLQPSLRGWPIAVTPTPVPSGCCIATSYEARQHGVKTGCSVGWAQVLCPEITIVEARPTEYIKLHHQIIEAVESCIPVSQVLSVDEMCCNLMGTEREPERANEIAQSIKQTLAANIGPSLTCSIGIGPNQFIAKVASDINKPNGITLIKRSDLPDALYTLELDDLPGIARGMTPRLNQAGVQTIEQLCALSER